MLATHALANKPPRQEFKVRLDFVAELAIRLSLTEEAAEPRYKAKNQRGHDCFGPSRRRIRPITPEIVSQFDVSIASCLSPRLVIE